MKKLSTTIILHLSIIGVLLTFTTSCNKEPIAMFSTVKTTVETGEVLIFTNTSTNAERFEWDFGDYEVSTLESPDHAFSNTGSYCVHLTAYSKKDKKHDEYNIVINVVPASGGIKVIKYGFLYNWFVVNDSRNITSSITWRVPSESDFNILVATCGGSYPSGAGGQSLGGGKLKSIGTTYWASPNIGATDEFNYDARGASLRSNNGTFSTFYQSFWIWASNLGYDDKPWNLGIYYNNNIFDKGRNVKLYGFSLRLVRNTTSNEQLLSNGSSCDPYIGNDGMEYKTVKIGSQVWTAENLIETQYRNGDAIPIETDNTNWASLTTGARCSYENTENNAFIIQ